MKKMSKMEYTRIDYIYIVSTAWNDDAPELFVSPGWGAAADYAYRAAKIAGEDSDPDELGAIIAKIERYMYIETGKKGSLRVYCNQLTMTVSEIKLEIEAGSVLQTTFTRTGLDQDINES